MKLTFQAVQAIAAADPGAFDGLACYRATFTIPTVPVTGDDIQEIKYLIVPEGPITLKKIASLPLKWDGHEIRMKAEPVNFQELLEHPTDDASAAPWYSE